MMTREEFEAFHLPILNEMAARRNTAPFFSCDLDGLWHNYLHQQEENLRFSVDADMTWVPE